MKQINLTSWNPGTMVDREHAGYAICATQFIHTNGEIGWSVTARHTAGDEAPNRFWIQGSTFYDVARQDARSVDIDEAAKNLEPGERLAILEVISDEMDSNES